MKRIGIALILIGLILPLSTQISAQNDLTKEIEEMNRRTDSMNRSIDSLNESINKMFEEENDRMLKEQLEQNQRNLEEFARRQAEQNEKTKKRLWLKGGGLVAVIIAMVVGRLRRRKNDTAP